MREINYEVLSKSILNNLEILKEFGETTLVITRADGVVLWTNNKDQETDHSLGALISGLWSSAKAVTDIFQAENINNFLTYGGSSDGIHILPIILGGKRFAFSAIYKKVLNPSKLKLKFRLLNKLIEEEYEEKATFVETVDVGKEKTKTLFNNITDEEIDNLFTL